MDTLADYEAWKAKQRKTSVGAATVVLGASDAQPDQLAGDLNLAAEFGKLTGKPVPPAPMVTEYRSVFQQAIEKTRAETILSTSPRLTEWLRNPENATLAKDDLDGLSWWETGLGASWNSVRRAGNSVPQTYNQALALEYSQDAADLKRGFGELLYDERTPVIDENGVELARNWATPVDLLGAAWRYYDSRIAGGLGALGVTDDPAKVAAQYQMQAEELRRNIGAIPMSPGAQAVREKLGTINSGTWQDQLSQFGALIAEDPVGFTSFIGQVGLESVPSIAASVGVGVATRNPAAAAATMGALSGAREYGSGAGDVVAEGGYDLTTPEGALAAISDEALMRKAQKTGQVRALVIGALDGLSGGVAGKVLAQNPVGNMLLQTMTQALFGSGGEALAQAASGQDLKLADILIEGLAEAFTAPAEVAGMGIAKVREMQGKARDAEGRVALFQELSGQAVNSKLRARMPDRFRQFVDQATAKGPVENVFVPAQDFVQYFQTSGIDPYALIDELDGVTRDDLDAALAGGGDLRIPTSTYAAKLAGSEHDAFLMENMRFDPLDMTSREAVEFNSRVDDIMQDMWAEAEDVRQEEDRWRAVEEQIHDQVVSQMRAAGLSTERAMAEVQPIVAFYRTRAARMGLTTEEYLAKNPLPQIQGAIPQGMQFKNVDDLNRTLAEARNRRAPKADTRQSLLEFIDGYGGVNDVGGEFAARDAAVIKRGKGKKTLRLARDGAGAGQGSMLGPNIGGKRFGYDDVAQAAIEAGFMADDPLVLEYKAAMRDGGQVPDLARALLDAVDAELSGNKQTSDQDADPVDEAYLDEIESYLNRLGLDLSNTDDEIRAAIDADQAAPDRMYGQNGALNTDSAAFKAWFGDSKVVDADGKPLVVYHGTAADFEAFSKSADPKHIDLPGFFFTPDAMIADNFAESASRKPFRDDAGYIAGFENAAVMPVYLSIQNPAEINLSDRETGKMMRAAEVRAMLEKAQADGHDGAVIRGWSDGSGDVQWVAFTPTQIKSVNNRGTFDANDARILFQVTPDQARQIDMAAELPVDPLFAEAVANTDGAEITEDGLLIDLVRYQKAEQEGATSVRTGVFYLPVGSKNARHYKAGGQGGQWYGGPRPIKGQTLVKRPLFVKGATGGKAPEAAYDAIKGKGASKKLNDDARSAALSPRHMREEVVSRFLDENGADGSMAWEIIENSKLGNQLTYALQENVVAHAVREAGHDSVIGYSKGKAGASISEVFDVREIDYPTPGEQATLHPNFQSRTYNQSSDTLGGLLSDARDRIAPGAGPTLFQNISGPRGSFSPDTNLIRLYESANLSTLQHEMGHLFLTMMQRDVATGDAATVAEYEVIKSWWRENAKAVAADGNRAMPDAKLTPEDVQRAIDLGTTGDMMKDAAIDVGMQEQWARGYEAYQMEGKAPSIELRAVFAKFRSWMISVYKSMVGLNVKINDDIRGVFDRMLATDEEIAKAKASSGETGAVFATAEQMGLTPEEFERFQKLRVQAEDEAKARLQIEIMEPIRRETEKEYMAEKAKVTEATTTNLRRAPVFRAIQEMRFGKTFEGEETPIKLDRGIIEDQYGSGYIPFLPGATKDGKGHRNAVFAAEGLHPDVAAGMYGFTTGRELLDAMTNAPDIDAAIKAEVEAEMYRRHGDPLKDGEIERRALEVLHNDKRGEWMAAELKAVAEVAGVDVALTMKDARASARQALGLMRVKDATAAMRFLAAERKAGNEAARLGAMLAREGVWMQNARRRIATKSRAALRDDATVGAVAGQVEKANASTENYNDTVQRLIDAKRRQLMNHALFMEATKQLVAVEKTTDRLAKLNRSDKRLSGPMTVDHVKAARAIAAKFGLARADSTFDFNAWMEQLTFDDPIRAGALSEAVTAWGEADKNYRDMTVNEFGALVDSIDNVLETGKRFSGIETAGKRIDREQAVAELTAVFDDRGYADNEAMAGAMKGLKKIMHDAKTLTSSSRAMLRVMETWARTMDNGEQGPFTNYLVRPVMDALGQYFENRKQKMDDLLAIVEGAKSKMNGNAIPAPELRGQGKQPYAFQNKAALLHAILHTGNESNKAKMLIGWGFSDGFVNQTQAVTALGKPRAKKDGSPIMTKGELDTTRWDAFLDRMIREGMITSEDIDLVNSIWGVFEETKRPAQSTHKKLKGFYFKEIENSPYQTAAGMLKGGYVPAMIDKEASLDAGRQGDMRALDQSSTSMFPSTGAGFTKSRVENYREPLELNLMLLPSHLDDVLRFTYLEPAIQQTASLVRGRDLRDTMQRADPNLVGDTIMPWLQRTASRSLDTGATTAGRRRWGRTFDRLRSRIGISIMFMNVVNTAQQITGPIVAASEVSPRRLGRALVRMVSGDAPAMRKAIEDASPYMKERLRLVANDSQIALRDLVQDKGVFTEVDRFTQKHGYLLQSAFQSLLDVPVWHGAYDQAISRGMDRDSAIFEADSAVRRFMPDSAPENVTAFAQGSVTWRMITMFTSFFISQANLLGGRMDVIRRTMGWNGAPQAFWAYLTLFALPAIVAQAISDAASGAGPEDDDDDGMMDEMLAWFGVTQLRYGAAMVPFAGQATLRTISAFNDNPVDDRLSVSPVVSSVETAVRAGASVYGAVADDGSARRATIDGLTVIALVTGIPTGQLGRLLGYGIGVSEGRYDPAGPVDVVQGVVSGRDGTER